MVHHLVLPEWMSTPNHITLFTVALVVTSVVIALIVKRIKFIRKVDLIPGIPGGLTILGNALLMLDVPTHGRNRTRCNL